MPKGIVIKRNEPVLLYSLILILQILCTIFITLQFSGLLTYLNTASVKLYVWVQNIFSSFKVLACLIVVSGGIYEIVIGNGTLDIQLTCRIYELNYR